MKPFVIYPDKSYPRESVRPHFCYADGFLEDDLGAHMGEYGQSDYFHLSATFKRALDENDAVKEGTYSCQFNGRPATLFVVPTGGGHTEGLCCYDDDEESLRYIKEWLEDHNRLELFPTTPKMEDNWPKHCEIKSQINKKLISLNYTPTVAVDLYGHHANFTELQVRALQLIAIQKANEGEDAWQEFCANVVVYSCLLYTSYRSILQLTRKRRTGNVAYLRVSDYRKGRVRHELEATYKYVLQSEC